MGISKTRQTLIDIARQLFAENGKDNVTMNDIAIASQKGRRTLYTYFRNKHDIYLAVIEREISLLRDKLEVVIKMDLPPDKILEEYIFVRLRVIKESITRNGSLQADFFRDIYEVEHARRRMDIWEANTIAKILQRGVDEKIFDCKDPKIAATLFLYALKGVEQPYFRNKISRRIDVSRKYIVKMLFHGLLLHENEMPANEK